MGVSDVGVDDFGERIRACAGLEVGRDGVGGDHDGSADGVLGGG
jgi:hypothetical protein